MAGMAGGGDVSGDPEEDSTGGMYDDIVGVQDLTAACQGDVSGDPEEGSTGGDVSGDPEEDFTGGMYDDIVGVQDLTAACQGDVSGDPEEDSTGGDVSGDPEEDSTGGLYNQHEFDFYKGQGGDLLLQDSALRHRHLMQCCLCRESGFACSSLNQQAVDCSDSALRHRHLMQCCLSRESGFACSSLNQQAVDCSVVDSGIVNDIEAENVQLKKENATLKAENVQLKKENATLKAKIEELEATVKAPQDDPIAKLNVQLWERLNKLEAENKKLQADLEAALKVGGPRVGRHVAGTEGKLALHHAEAASSAHQGEQTAYVNPADQKNQLGNIAFQAKDFKEAVAVYGEAIAMAGDGAPATYFFNRAVAWAALGDWQRSRDDAERAMHRSSDITARTLFHKVRAEMMLDDSNAVEQTMALASHYHLREEVEELLQSRFAILILVGPETGLTDDMKGIAEKMLTSRPKWEVVIRSTGKPLPDLMLSPEHERCWIVATTYFHGEIGEDGRPLIKTFTPGSEPKASAVEDELQGLHKLDSDKLPANIILCSCFSGAQIGSSHMTSLPKTRIWVWRHQLCSCIGEEAMWALLRVNEHTGLENRPLDDIGLYRRVLMMMNNRAIERTKDYATRNNSPIIPEPLNLPSLLFVTGDAHAAICPEDSSVQTQDGPVRSGPRILKTDVYDVEVKGNPVHGARVLRTQTDVQHGDWLHLPVMGVAMIYEPQEGQHGWKTFSLRFCSDNYKVPKHLFLERRGATSVDHVPSILQELMEHHEGQLPRLAKRTSPCVAWQPP